MRETLAPRGFGALSSAGFRTYLLTFLLTMLADNVEHVISYWLVFQKFHSAALGGFAVVAHWLPYLVLSVPVGALNDRFDSRRLIQVGAGLFMLVSLGWGILFASDTLQMWHAMVLLVLHGCAGVFWITSSQLLLYDMVGPAQLESAVRINATVRYLGMLAGPGVGSLFMLTLGPVYGIFVNAAVYLPLLLWLVRAPYGRHHHGQVRLPSKPAFRGIRDILETARQVRGIPEILVMVVLAGAASFFVGNSYQAQMPGFAQDLGHGDPGMAYMSLLGMDAAGALVGGFMLESGRVRLPVRATSALRLSVCWAFALLGFALVPQYWLALPLLFLAGFFELAFSSMAQALVQLHAPEALRGRVLGLFSMASSGLRTFSGLTVGLAGSITNIHASLAGAATAFLVVIGVVLARRARE